VCCFARERHLRLGQPRHKRLRDTKLKSLRLLRAGHGVVDGEFDEVPRSKDTFERAGWHSIEG
jgi:hypothetical protein